MLSVLLSRPRATGIANLIVQILRREWITLAEFAVVKLIHTQTLAPMLPACIQMKCTSDNKIYSSSNSEC